MADLSEKQIPFVPADTADSTGQVWPSVGGRNFGFIAFDRFDAGTIQLLCVFAK